MDEDIRTVVLVTVGFLLVLLVVLPSGCFVCSTIEYGEGYRDGIVNKVSDKGVFFTTTEGEMLLGGFEFAAGEGGGGGGGSSNRFEFSVSDAAVKAKLRQLPPGKRVRLHYKERMGAWIPRGETRYFVTDVEVLR